MRIFRLAGLARFLLSLSSFFFTAAAPQSVEPAPEAFLVKPYLQLGARSKTDGLALLWHTEDLDAIWRVEVKSTRAQEWFACETPESRRVSAPGVGPHRVYRAFLSKIGSGETVDYRVLRDGSEVFRARTQGRKSADQPHRFVVFGDCGAGSVSQPAVAQGIYKSKPDFVLVTGDVVYSRGRMSEYRQKFFPIYNADEGSAAGAPLGRSTLFVAAPGNHDMGGSNLSLSPDGLAYFLYWDQPLNGPITKPGEPYAPLLQGPEEMTAGFLKSAGSAYPRMANFSFDYGNAHWTIIDSNRYVDWTDQRLRAWLSEDLAASRSAAWRFVAFHHPPFHSSRVHFNDQWMRVLADVFQSGGVDIVFGGHVHNYERSLPLRFLPKPGENGRGDGRVRGELKVDHNFDGKKHSKPDGVLYLVTGAGGAGLYNPEQQDDRSSWLEFTDRFFSRQHSFTVVDLNGKKLTAAQVAEDGRVLDQFSVSK